MKDSIRFKLESVRDRFEEIAGLLADPDVIADQNQFRDLSMEYSRVEPIVKLFAEFETLDEDIAAAREMVNDDDPDVREMGQDELEGLTAQREILLLDLLCLLQWLELRSDKTFFGRGHGLPGPELECQQQDDDDHQQETHGLILAGLPGDPERYPRVAPADRSS